MTITNADNETVITPGNTTGSTRSIIKFSGAITNDQLEAAVSSVAITRGADNMFVLARSLYLADDCDLSGLRNITLDVGLYDIYVHPDAPDTIWRNVRLRMSGNRLYSESGDNQNRLVFKEQSVYNAEGGSYTSTPEAGGGTSGNSRRVSIINIGNISNVAITTEDHCTVDMPFMPLYNSGEFRNIRATRVDSVNTPGFRNNSDMRIIMHDCTFNGTGTNSQGTRFGVINAGNAILNDCSFSRYDGATPQNPNERIYDWGMDNSVRIIPHHLYLLGTTSEMWVETWSGQGGNNGPPLHLWRGSLRYLQAYKNGVPEGGFHWRVYSQRSGDTSRLDRESTPDLSDGGPANMKTLPNAAAPSSGKIEVIIFDRLRTKFTGSWTTESYSDCIIRIRAPDIIFNDIPISDADMTVSQGRPDNYVPFVLQPDPHYHDEQIPLAERNTNYQFNHNTNTITIPNNQATSPREMYYAAKNHFSEYAQFDHDFTWTYNGERLNLGDWNLVLGDNAVMNAQGREILTSGQITIGTNFVNHGVTLIDANGVTVRVSSPALGARAIITYDTTVIYSEVNPGAWSGLIPLNKEFKVTVKAPGYAYETYTLNTNVVSDRVLDARLARDTTVDLSIGLSSNELNNICTLHNHTSTTYTIAAQHLEVHLGEIDLRDNLPKSRRIFDFQLSKDVGLRWLHEYVHDFSSPTVLGGRAYEYLGDRVKMPVSNMMDSGKVKWIKDADETQDCRWGDPMFPAEGTAAYKPTARADHGRVQFDNVILQGATSAEVVTASTEAILSNTDILDGISSAIWNKPRAELTETDSVGELVETQLPLINSSSGDDTTTTTPDPNPTIGYFDLDRIPVAGGGEGFAFLDHATRPNDLWFIRKEILLDDDDILNQFHYIETREYDSNGRYLGNRVLFDTSSPVKIPLTATTVLNSAYYNASHMYVSISDGGTHRVGRFSMVADGSNVADVNTNSSATVAICDGGDAMIGMERQSNTHIILYKKPYNDFTGSATNVTVLPFATTSDNIFMAVYEADGEEYLGILHGTQFKRLNIDTFADEGGATLPFVGTNLVWWQEHVWTIDKVSDTEWRFQPMNPNTLVAIPSEHPSNITKGIQNDVTKVLQEITAIDGKIVTIDSIADTIELNLRIIEEYLTQDTAPTSTSFSANTIFKRIKDIATVVGRLPNATTIAGAINLNPLATTQDVNDARDVITNDISDQLLPDNVKIQDIKNIVDKIRFVGDAVDGKQKVDAQSTVVGRVESSGLTETESLLLQLMANSWIVSDTPLTSKPIPYSHTPAGLAVKDNANLYIIRDNTIESLHNDGFVTELTTVIDRSLHGLTVYNDEFYGIGSNNDIYKTPISSPGTTAHIVDNSDPTGDQEDINGLTVLGDTAYWIRNNRVSRFFSPIAPKLAINIKDIAIRSSTLLWALDGETNSVIEYNSRTTRPTGKTIPLDDTVDPERITISGNIMWVADNFSAKLYRYDITTYTPPDPTSADIGITNNITAMAISGSELFCFYTIPRTGPACRVYNASTLAFLRTIAYAAIDPNSLLPGRSITSASLSATRVFQFVASGTQDSLFTLTLNSAGTGFTFTNVRNITIDADNDRAKYGTIVGSDGTSTGRFAVFDKSASTITFRSLAFGTAPGNPVHLPPAVLPNLNIHAMTYDNGIIYVSNTQAGRHYIRQIDAVTGREIQKASRYIAAGGSHVEAMIVVGTDLWVLDSLQRNSVWRIPFSTLQPNTNVTIQSAPVFTLDTSGTPGLPTGIAKNGDTVYISLTRGTVRAYDASNSYAYTSGSDITLDTENGDEGNIVVYDGHLYVMDKTDDKAYAYNLSSGTRVESRDIDLETGAAATPALAINPTDKLLYASFDRSGGRTFYQIEAYSVDQTQPSFSLYSADLSSAAPTGTPLPTNLPHVTQNVTITNDGTDLYVMINGQLYRMNTMGLVTGLLSHTTEADEQARIIYWRGYIWHHHTDDNKMVPFYRTALSEPVSTRIDTLVTEIGKIPYNGAGDRIVATLEDELVDVGSVAGNGVTSTEDFKGFRDADRTELGEVKTETDKIQSIKTKSDVIEFDDHGIHSSVHKVNGTDVTSIEDFKALTTADQTKLDNINTKIDGLDTDLRASSDGTSQGQIIDDFVSAIWSYQPVTNHSVDNMIQSILAEAKLARQIAANKYSFTVDTPAAGQVTLKIFDDDETTVLKQFVIETSGDRAAVTPDT